MLFKDQDILSGTILILFSLAGYFFAAQLENMAVADLSAAFFPSILFTILLLCGGILVYKGIKRNEKVALPVINWKQLIPMLITLGLYVILLGYLGFMISTVLFVAVAMIVFGERNVKLLVAVPLITSFAVYYLFSTAFMMVLP